MFSKDLLGGKKGNFKKLFLLEFLLLSLCSALSLHYVNCVYHCCAKHQHTAYFNVNRPAAMHVFMIS